MMNLRLDYSVKICIHVLKQVLSEETHAHIHICSNDVLEIFQTIKVRAVRVALSWPEEQIQISKNKKIYIKKIKKRIKIQSGVFREKSCQQCDFEWSRQRLSDSVCKTWMDWTTTKREDYHRVVNKIDMWPCHDNFTFRGDIKNPKSAFCSESLQNHCNASYMSI